MVTTDEYNANPLNCGQSTSPLNRHKSFTVRMKNFFTRAAHRSFSLSHFFSYPALPQKTDDSSSCSSVFTFALIPTSHDWNVRLWRGGALTSFLRGYAKVVISQGTQGSRHIRVIYWGAFSVRCAEPKRTARRTWTGRKQRDSTFCMRQKWLWVLMGRVLCSYKIQGLDFAFCCERVFLAVIGGLGGIFMQITPKVKAFRASFLWSPTETDGIKVFTERLELFTISTFSPLSANVSKMASIMSDGTKMWCVSMSVNQLHFQIVYVRRKSYIRIVITVLKYSLQEYIFKYLIFIS